MLCSRRLVSPPPLYSSRLQWIPYSRGGGSCRFQSSLAEPDVAGILSELKTRELPVLYSSLDRRHKDQYDATLRGFLPAEDHHDNQSMDAISSFRRSLSVLTTQFNHTEGTNHLLPDGTDRLHYPGPPWNMRIWAGGRVKSHAALYENPEPRWVMAEAIEHVEIIGKPPKDRINMRIKRAVGLRRDGWPAAQYRESLIQGSDDTPLASRLMEEERVLCFMREPSHDGESPLKNWGSIRQMPGPPTFSHKLTPTPSLLARFSALTFNAHAIHLDPEYARAVCGLPDIVVHGPLTVVLMLEVVQRALTMYHLEHNLPMHEPCDIEYKNLLPLFVNEEMTICCLRTGSAAVAPESALWHVWIQKETPAGPTMAVRGRVRTRKQGIQSADSPR